MRVLPTGQQPGTGSPFGGSAPLSQSPALFGSGSAPSPSGGLFGAAPGIQQPFGTISTASVDMGTASSQTSSTGRVTVQIVHLSIIVCNLHQCFNHPNYE